MEGYGISTTSEYNGKKWIIIKGICDWGYNKQNHTKDKDQEIAARNASSLVISVLKNKNLIGSK